MPDMEERTYRNFTSLATRRILLGELVAMDVSLAANLLAKLPEDGLRAGLLNMLDGTVGSRDGGRDVVYRW